MGTEKDNKNKKVLKHITVKISEDVHRKLKVKAAMEGIHMKDLMEKLIIEHTK